MTIDGVNANIEDNALIVAEVEQQVDIIEQQLKAIRKRLAALRMNGERVTMINELVILDHRAPDVRQEHTHLSASKAPGSSSVRKAELAEAKRYVLKKEDGRQLDYNEDG